MPSQVPQAQDDGNGNLKEHGGGEVGKRRSFLPQRGLPRSLPRGGRPAPAPAPATRAHTTSVPYEAKDTHSGSNDAVSLQSTGAPGIKQGRLRPRSLYQPSSNHPAVRKDGESAAVPQAARSANPVVKPPVSAGLSRSQSLRRPGITAPPAQPGTRGHTRTQSSSTTGSALKQHAEINNNRAERPRSLYSALARPAKPASDHKTEPIAVPVRASARLEALRRSTSTRAQPEASHGSTTDVSTSGPEKPSHLQGRQCATPEEEPKKPARPAFSTLQQHFTPRKAAKAATSVFLRPAPDTSQFSLPPETISLQSELLQLQLMHEASAQTSKRWELSAQNCLRTKFDEVASLYEVMRESERHGQEQKNLLALREWNGTSSTSGLVEHIQALSGPLHELPSLMDPGSRLHCIVGDFERWLDEVKRVWAARASAQGGADSKPLEGLGVGWEEQNAGLTRKLTAFLRHLSSLPKAAQGSSIASIVACCEALLEGVIAELQMMKTIVVEVVERERRWIEERLRQIAQDVSPPVLVVEDGQAWRS